MKKMLVLLLFGLIFWGHPAVFAQETSASVRERLGVYVWGSLASPSADPLVVTIEDARSLGADQVIRTSISPYWDPRGETAGESQFLPLWQKMHRTDYWEFLNSFPVVMITAYDVASYPAKYRFPGFTDYGSVTEEFRRFSFNLACEIPNGTFVISNWEAENDGAATTEQWQKYLKYIQARLDGISAGKKEAEEAGCSGKVYSAFEFINIKDLGGEWDNKTGPISGITAASQLQGMDYLSYSSWNSIGYMHPPDYIRASFTEAIRNIRSFARQNGITDKLIIGEFGELWDLYPDTEHSRLGTILETSLAEGVEYLFNWVFYEQPGNGVWVDGKWYDQSHFGKLYQNRELTPQGNFIKDLLAR